MGMNNLSLSKEDRTIAINTMTDIIQEYFCNHKGKITYAFLTSYDGMAMTTLEDLILSLPGGNDFVINGNYDVCCGAKKSLVDVENSYLVEDLLKHVHRICVKNAFHPKIYMFFYKPEDEAENKIFLIVASKNITDTSYLDAYVCLEGVKQAVTSGNGSRLKAIITEELEDEIFLGSKELAREIADKLEDLENYQFSLYGENAVAKAEVSFHRPDEMVLKNILDCKASAPDIIVVSPFVTDKIWGDAPVRLYTSKEEADKLSTSPEKGIYCLRKDIFEQIPSLHAKIYIKHCMEEHCTQLWIGSANFTQMAFSKNNSEIMVCLNFPDSEQKIYNALVQSFEEEIEGVKIWEATEPGSVGRGEKKVYIPVCVYKELDTQLKVSAQAIGTNGQWSHTYDSIHISCLREIKIMPGQDFPTRNGSISFKYVKDNEEIKGSFSFDLISKMDPAVCVGYLESLEEHAKSERQKRNEKLLTLRRLSGIRKNPLGKKTGVKTPVSKQIGRKATLFDVVLQKKMYMTEDEIKDFLKSYSENYIGDMDSKEQQLINIFMEE